MFCDKCQKNKATVTIYVDINGEKAKCCLCESCAKSLSAKNSLFSVPGLLDLTGFESVVDKINGTLSEFAPPNSDAAEFQKTLPSSSAYDKTAKCTVCGAAFSEIAQNLRFGCANCYKIFGQDILGDKSNAQPLPSGSFEQSNGATSKEARIKKLKSRLEAAIKKENYEKAAAIRDEIKKLSEEDAKGNSTL